MITCAVPAAPPAFAVVHTQINGDGSTWAQNAVTQWIVDLQQQGLKVTFIGTGSAQGRTDFAQGTVDFAVSDVAYQGRDPVSGAVDSSTRPYAYLPIAAGGTAFAYHLVDGGQLVRTVRLSGLTVAKIFTNQITNWADPEITADNNGHQQPSLPITPVVHSEGAGSTLQFTTWLADEYPSLWSTFSGSSGPSEYFPRQGNQVAQNGSEGVMNFVASPAGVGAIGYDEYSYALGRNYPVAKVENAAGYFTLPTQYNVAIALTQAKIDNDPSSSTYLQQNLVGVYDYGDPRTYPLSSYSYAIIPTSPTDPTMDTSKRQTLADFLDYDVCAGQGEIGPIGYGPLPLNLVDAALTQVRAIGQTDPNVDVSGDTLANCHNPTFDPANPGDGWLSAVAPQPPACDAVGAGPCGFVSGTPTPPSTVPEFSSAPAAAAIAALLLAAGTVIGWRRRLPQ